MIRTCQIEKRGIRNQYGSSKGYAELKLQSASKDAVSILVGKLGLSLEEALMRLMG